MRQTRRFLCISTVLLAAQIVGAVQKQYNSAKVLEIQQKTRDKVDMYLVNTPVTTAVPYFEITLQTNRGEYIAEYTPRHADEELPAEWVVGADVSMRFDKHNIFLKRPDGSETKWIITKHPHRTNIRSEKLPPVQTRTGGELP